jgi:uracil-DNA glycosylase
MSGIPFADRSGSRLRSWLGLDEATFYDANKVAIVPMGSCFPGQDAKGGDLPPRRECAEIWRRPLFEALPNLELVLLIGQYAQAWHLGDDFRNGLTQTVKRWRDILSSSKSPRFLPLPHPSWRNNGWLRKNPWFETDLLPLLQNEVHSMISSQ